MVAQRLNDLLIGKLQQLRPPLNQRHPHAQRGKHARILHPNHAAAHDNHRLRQVHQVQHQVAVDNVAPVDRHLRRTGRLGARANQNIRRFVHARTARVRHPHMRRIFKARHPHQHLDVVARKLRLRHIDLGLDHMLHPERQVRHRDPFLHPVVHAIDGLVVIPREVQHRLTHRLRRNRAGVDRGPAHHLAHLHQRNLLSQLRPKDGGALSGRPGPNHNQIVNTTHSGTYSGTSTPSLWLALVPLSAQTQQLVRAGLFTLCAFAALVLKLPHQHQRLHLVPCSPSINALYLVPCSKRLLKKSMPRPFGLAGSFSPAKDLSLKEWL